MAKFEQLSVIVFVIKILKMLHFLVFVTSYIYFKRVKNQDLNKY